MIILLSIFGCSSSDAKLDSTENKVINNNSIKDSVYGKIVNLSEPSGICYSSLSDTLFVACDNGFIYELSKNGKVINKKSFNSLKNHDFEGIAYNENEDLLFVAIEGSDNVLVLDRSLKSKRTINLNREDSSGRLILKKDKENGLEGIAIDQRGEVYISNQSFNKFTLDDPSAIIHIDSELGDIKEVINPSFLNISGLSFYEDYLYMVSDTNNLLIKYDIPNKMIITSIKVKTFSSDLKGIALEGVTFDNEDNIYFTDDKGGKIFKYKFNR